MKPNGLACFAVNLHCHLFQSCFPNSFYQLKQVSLLSGSEATPQVAAVETGTTIKVLKCIVIKALAVSEISLCDELVVATVKWVHERLYSVIVQLLLQATSPYRPPNC